MLEKGEKLSSDCLRFADNAKKDNEALSPKRQMRIAYLLLFFEFKSDKSIAKNVFSISRYEITGGGISFSQATTVFQAIIQITIP